MGRKRKISLPNKGKVNRNEEENQLGNTSSNNMALMSSGPIYTIMSKVQLNETFHKKYTKELKQLYEKMDHDAFIYAFLKMIKTAMVAEETNEFAYTTLIFCAKFVSSFEGDETHPLLSDICRWLMTTISNNPHIRFRLCQFVNMILNALGNEATLDDIICDNIMEYMLGRLVDCSPSVRVQAILAMQRLQVPDNPDDPVLRSYQYHLCSDPSPRVRQAVITSMGRNYHTIPYILDRLWDIDEKVRRHTYLHMSSYPVRSYKVSQRLTLLEQGLNDRSESVRKVVTNVMLQQWIESYQKDLVALIGALKLDSNDAEINRYRKIGKQILKEIFKRQNKADILNCLKLGEDGDFYRCVPHERLNLEMAFYWQCLTEYLQNEMAEELDLIIPELSIFCTYVESYCQTRKSEMDKFEAMEFQYVLLSLMEILYTYDLGDEIGRGNLQKLLNYLLRNFTLDEKVIEVVVKCSENLITDQNLRHQFFLDIIHDVCGLNAKQQDLVHDRNLISELLANSTDADLNLKLSSLKVKIMDLEEQEMNYVQTKDYVRAQQIIEEKNNATEEFTNLLRPLLEKRSGSSGDAAQPQFSKVVKQDCILRSLQITYYMVVSKRVKTVGHATCRLYNDFIFRNIASNQITIRDWALKCGAAFSMLYEPLAKDVFDELYAQFFKNHNIRIWETAITCIFELLDRYGVDSFVVQEEQNKAKKSGRQLYNTLEFIDADDDTRQSTTLGQGVGVIYMMSHFLDTCDDMCIIRAIIKGFCRLVLHGHIENRDIMEKLLLRYFNPATDAEINQILGVFLENLISHRKQNLLQPCLIATVHSVLSAPYDSPLHDIRPETITRFIIDATRPDSVTANGCENSHNTLASVFLNEMVNNSNNKELCKLLAKELITLEVNVMQQEELKKEMKELADKLILNKFDPKTVKSIIDFKDMMDGVFNPPTKRTNEDIESDDEDDEGQEPNPSEKYTETADTVSEANTEATEISRTSVEPQAVANAIETSNTQDESNNSTLVPSQTADVLPSAANMPTTIVEPQTNANEIETSNPQDESNNSTLVSSQTADVSPSAANLPTTFGSENVPSLRYLRKSLNLSRNNSIDSNGTPGNGTNAPRPSKIRIEARIDSDKKSKNPNKNPVSSNSRSKRSLRYNKRNTNEEEEVEAAEELSSPIPREPEIIEKILSSPEKSKTPPKSNQESRLTYMPQTPDRDRVIPAKNLPQNENSPENEKKNNQSRIIESTRSHRAARKTKETNTDHPETVFSEELDTSEVIHASPTSASQRMTSSAVVMGTAGTPLRNGRKRVLRISPQQLLSTSTSATCMSSPVRKQPCIEIDTTEISSASTSTPRRTRRSYIAKNPANYKTVPQSKTATPAPKQQSNSCLDGETEVVAITTQDYDNTVIVNPISNKENKVRETKSVDASSLSKSSSRTGQTVEITKTPSRGQRQNQSILKSLEKAQQKSPVVTTRNSAKKELISKMIMTRKRHSQENLLVKAPISKPATKSLVSRSRIPVRLQKDNSSDTSSASEVKKKPNAKSERLLSAKNFPGRSLRTKMPSSVLSSRLPMPLRSSKTHATNV